MKRKKLYSLISIPLLLTASHIIAKPIDNVAISLEQVTEDVHYLASEKDGKKTKWTALFNNGEWVQNLKS